MPRVQYFVKITPKKGLSNPFKSDYPLHYEVFFHLVQISHQPKSYLVMPAEKWQEMQHQCSPYGRQVGDPLTAWDSWNLKIETFAHLLV